MRDGILVTHIMAGGIGLAAGPATLLMQGAARVVGAIVYFAAVTTVAVTAFVLVVTAFDQFWWLLPVAAGTQVAAVGGWWAWRARPSHWPAWCAHLLGGSYVALVTGTMLAFTGQPIFWVLPAVVAQWPIAIAKRRLAPTSSPAAVAAS